MKLWKILLISLMLISAVTLIACDSEIKYKAPMSNIKYTYMNSETIELQLTEDEQKEILEILNGGKWINDLSNCGSEYEFTVGKATMRYHSECGTFNDITNDRSLTLSDEQKARVNQILQKNENEAPVIINDFAEYLDKMNFVSGVSQKDLCEMMKKYTYEGKRITDVLDGANFVAPNASGYSANGDHFGFKNEYRIVLSESKENSTNSFYTKVELGGLTLPYGITFEDTITDVFEKLGIEKDPKEDFVVDPDCTNGTAMTIWKNENSSLTLYNLSLTTAPVDFEHRYKLEYTETYQEQKDGKTVTVTRSVEFYIEKTFDAGDDTVDEFRITVKESSDA